MALTTYITAAEATYFYDDARYAAAEKSQALSMSALLVNSYINGTLQVPVVPEWNGSDTSLSAPGVLKLAQAKGYEYLLRRGEVGDTPAVLAVFEGFKEFCKSISQEELTIPEAGTYEREVGWHIVSKSNAGGGDVYITGGSPSYNEKIKLVISNAATASYPGTFTYTMQAPSRQSANVSTGNATSFYWLEIAALPDGSKPFQIRWEGKWTTADYVEITGVAPDMVNASPPPRDVIEQGQVAY